MNQMKCSQYTKFKDAWLKLRLLYILSIVLAAENINRKW